MLFPNRYGSTDIRTAPLLRVLKEHTLQSQKGKVFLYKILVSRSVPSDKEFVMYHSSEKKMSNERITKIIEETLRSSESGYKVAKITEIKLTP